jgi:putative transposase
VYATRSPIAEVAEKHSVSEQTIYAWRKRFGALEASDAKKLKTLGAENGRLKKLIAERDFEIDVTKEIAAKNAERASTSTAGGVRPSSRVHHMSNDRAHLSGLRNGCNCHDGGHDAVSLRVARARCRQRAEPDLGIRLRVRCLRQRTESQVPHHRRRMDVRIARHRRCRKNQRLSTSTPTRNDFPLTHGTANAGRSP